VFGWDLRRHEAVPVKDPSLEASLHYH
jgi:hypothetical protein